MDLLSFLRFCFYMLSFWILPTLSITTTPILSSSTHVDGNASDDVSGIPVFGSADTIAFRVEKGWQAVDEGVLYIYSNETTTIRLVGQEFGVDPISVTFTTSSASKGHPCDDLRSTDIFQSIEVLGDTALVDITLLPMDQPLYMCIRERNQTGFKSEFIHQGTKPWMILGVKQRPLKSYILPFWLQICVVVVLLIFSGLFSGLNLGLMSLDQTELNIMIASGTPKEKQYAKTILPLRKRGNFLLCTILLGNVLVNNCLTILLDDLTGSGMMAIVGATLAIVIFGEILPQAICSRYGLAVGARTIWFTRFFMVATFPLSFPISLILDKALGEEMGYVYNRDRLRELLRLTEKDIGLVTDEVNIITGALELSKKTVANIMTKIDDVFMIEYNSVLDFGTVSKIMESGYTRIPVYEKDRSNVVALLNTKDLAFVDPDDKIPLYNVTKFYNHILLYVFEDVKLDIILQDFKKGGSHMAMVQRVINDGPGDPFYQVVGLVTLEDVIEEIIQSEIYDEFDTVTDNKYKHPRLIRHKDYSVFNVPSNSNLPHLTPQLQLATYQFLSGTLTPFRPPHMTERILYKLMTQNIIEEHKQRLEDAPFLLYKHGVPSDFFVLIVQGRVLVQSGVERLTFEAGSFSYFGLQSLLVLSDQAQATSDQSALSSGQKKVDPTPIEPVMSMSEMSRVNAELAFVPATVSFVPDYTVRAMTDLQYLKINREQYLIAWRASQLEQELNIKGVSIANPEESFEKEWKEKNLLFMENTQIDTKSTKNNPSTPVSSHYGHSSFSQQIRRTLGMSHTSPESDSFSMSPNKTSLRKGVKFSLTKRPSITSSQHKVTVKSVELKLAEQDKKEKANKSKSPDDENKSSNSIPAAYLKKETALSDNSKSETEALLQDLDLIEVKIVKP